MEQGSPNLTQGQKPKKSKKKIIFIILLTLIGLVGWAGLTKAGYIPNFLGIEVLDENVDRYYPQHVGGGVDDACVKSCEEKKANTTSTEKNENPFLSDCNNMCIKAGKPVIYLYPEEEQNVEVQLDFKGELIAEYPKYDESIGGWSVTAFSNGRLINHKDNREYSYLFWEGAFDEPLDIDMTKGFVVKGNHTREFLQDILPKIGLLPHEYNEFIVYWYPLMQDSPYNYIHFTGDEYTSVAPLAISPEPDSMLRVFMMYKGMEEKIEVEPQIFDNFDRRGFSVVEWGGAEFK
jgi:hypothetical protein